MHVGPEVLCLFTVGGFSGSYIVHCFRGGMCTCLQCALEMGVVRRRFVFLSVDWYLVVEHVLIVGLNFEGRAAGRATCVVVCCF